MQNSIDSNPPFEIIKPLDRQFQNHHLLHTVKQVNGDYALRQVQQRSSILKFARRAEIPSSYTLNYFGYVSAGEVFIYKESRNKFYEEKYHTQIPHSLHFHDKVFITSHKAHQIFGFQEYPLNWAEHIIVEATEATKVIMFPIELSLTSFRKIFNLSVIQYRAQMLKRCTFFHQQQIDKLKKIALYSRRCQGSKGQIIVKQGDQITHLIVIISGQAYYIQNGNRQIVGRDKEIGLDDLLSQRKSEFFLSCLNECQFILVPRSQVMKLGRIKYKLQDKDSIPFKSRRATEYENADKTPRKDPHAQSADKRKPFFNRLNSKRGNVKIRPNTSVHRNEESADAQFNTFYDQQKTTPSKPNKHFRTESLYNDQFSRIQQTEEVGLACLSGQNVSLGQLCLRKFLNRKEKRENGQIMKYLRSNAPELKLNPSKDYALVKPLHVGDSSYVKNFKRKLKKTYIKSGGQKDRQQKRSEARFSFFFKEDSID